MTLLVIHGVDITHIRLVDLARLADQAKGFYDWVERQFRLALSRPETLDEILRTASYNDLKKSIKQCYSAGGSQNLPQLFDGAGRSYPHSKACYYFFSWIIRDAPQQRLSPLIHKISINSGLKRTEAEIEVIASLICKYRGNVKTFTWEAIREVFVARLEGSHRSIKGHEKEAVVRKAVVAAIHSYYHTHSNYGRFSGIEVADKQVMIGNESFDISVNLLDEHGKCSQRVLLPIKTRETEGGGHSHLFTRDILSAIQAVKFDNPNDYLVVVVVAKNWAGRETDHIRSIADHAAIFDLSPGEFIEFSDAEQIRLNHFFTGLFDGTITRRIVHRQECRMGNAMHPVIDTLGLKDTVLVGDCWQLSRQLPTAYTQCIVTSPPYFGHREYSDLPESQPFELGRESDPKQYVEKLVGLFQELQRVLDPRGTLWLNLGDTYRDEQLLGIPWRVAIGLQESGWILRSEIIWNKPNAMPSSVKNRPTTSHEHIFLLVKTKDYFYNADAIREPHVTFTENSRMKGGRNHFGKRDGTPENGKNKGNSNLHNGRWDQAFHPLGRNKRTVWEIPLGKFRQAHFAVFPEELVKNCILAGTSEGGIVLDPFMGSGTTAVIARQLGRRFTGIELVPRYAEMALKRAHDVAFQPNLFAIEDGIPVPSDQSIPQG